MSWLLEGLTTPSSRTQDTLLRLALSKQQADRSSFLSNVSMSRGKKSITDILADAIQETSNMRSLQEPTLGPLFRTGDTSGAVADVCRETPGDLPTKLYAILSNTEFEHIVSWMPHGYAWKIKDLNLFVAKILPVFVDRGTYPSNFNAFVRLLKSYGFKQVTRGPDTSAYYHEMFLRGIPNLHSLMRPILGAENRALHSPDNEPNFYSLRPLPVTDLKSSSISSTYNRIPVTPPTADPVPDFINQLIVSKAVAAAAGRSFRAISDASGFSPLSTTNFHSLKSATTSAGTTPFGSLTAFDLLRMNNDLRAAQHLHEESLQHLSEAKIIADLTPNTIPSLPVPTAATSPVEAKSKDAMKSPKKKRPRRKWLPPLGPPPPRPSSSTIGNATSSGGAGALHDWYLTNPEVFASLSEGSNPLPVAKK